MKIHSNKSTDLKNGNGVVTDHVRSAEGLREKEEEQKNDRNQDGSLEV